jgi:DNA-binding SARP family transcriptional activator
MALGYRLRRAGVFMDIRLLGSVEVSAVGRLVQLPQPRQRAVVAALAVDAGQPVPVQTLIDRVWGELAPRQVRQALYTYVSQLRQLIVEAGNGVTPAAALVRRSGGYVLDLDPDRVDIHRFRRLVAQAHDGACPPQQGVVLLRQALQLWRGTPLADLPGDWPARVRAAWQQEHLDAAVARARAELRTGNAEQAVGPLAVLVEDHPLNESLAAALMLVLHAAGRGADALHRYDRTRRRLAEDLGTDPGPDLQRLYQAILRGDLNHPATTPTPTPAPPAPLPPAQLPFDVPGFTGRDQELARLDALLASDDRPTAVVITAVSGTAGVGKTALAVHWAHRVRERYPDGQLYVNLRGFDPAGTVMAPAEAIRRFLDALGTDPGRIPAGPAAAMTATGTARGSFLRRWRLLAIDGFEVDVPDSKENAAEMPLCFVKPLMAWRWTW